MIDQDKLLMKETSPPPHPVGTRPQTGGGTDFSLKRSLLPLQAGEDWGGVAESSNALRRVEAYMRSEQERRQLFGAAGRIDQVTERGGAEFRYDYDANGDLTTLHEANGQTRHYTYDEQRRLHTVDHGDELTTYYRYNDEDRLDIIDDRGITTHYRYDEHGRIANIQRGRGEVSVYRYDEAGRVVHARTFQVSTQWRYDAVGRATLIEQSMRGVTIAVHFEYDADGRLSTMTLPGSDRPIRYTWDEQGRPQTVALDQRILARFGYDDATKTTTVALDNGTTTTTEANAADGRPTRHMVCRGEERLLARTLCYNDIGEIVSDGERHYGYDGLGRLISAQNEDDYQSYRFAHDNMDNLVMRSDSDKTVHVGYDTAGRLVAATTDEGTQTHFTHDRWGRLTQCVGPEGVKHYRYDDAGQLQEVRHDHALVARFRYDHKGRLVWAEVEGEIERYLYDDADELLAVTNAYGQPRRLLIRTPLGVLAQVQGTLETEAILFRHDDERGTTRLLTDRQGEIVARFAYDPFGRPIATSQASQGDTVQQMPCLTNRNWYAAIGLYYFGARWYDPVLGRFLTPDSYTGAPDDARLLNPLYLASRQPALRCQILNEWLKQPRVRNAYAFCGNDPVGRVDPTGHWSFGGVLLMLLGAIWTLPNTLFGILVEITCLVGEVIRWLVWLFSGGNVSWQTPGFDAAASGHLNAFALVFTGGWLGSFSNLLGITFGNVFFVYKEWPTSPHITSLPDPIFPPAYNGSVSIPRNQMLYEHELRHTNQYGWLGPFFHLGLPLFGFYEWDVIINGYQNAWTERDARAHAEP